jgi:hypothetical protein
VSTGVALMWPAMTLLAFLALTGVVVVLGASSTARFEFERNGAREPQRSAAPTASAHPAGSRMGNRAAEVPGVATQAVGVAVRAGAPAGEDRKGPAWWLVVDGTHVVAGPYRDRVDAEWAALSDGLAASAKYGVLRADGDLVRRPSPEERAWLTELGDQLDRLPREWETVLSDTDPLTTLVVEVAAALVEAGLPVHDAQGDTPAGGVCLLPDLDLGGVLVSWRPHDRMTLLHTRGAVVDAEVRAVMNAAVAAVLEETGFVLGPFGETDTHLVTAIRP